MRKFLCVALLSSTVAFDLQDYENNYLVAKDKYDRAVARLNDAMGPYEAARDAYVSATSTFTHSLYPDLETTALPSIDMPKGIDLPTKDDLPSFDDILANYHGKRRLGTLSPIFKLEHEYWAADHENRELIAQKYLTSAHRLISKN
jgi:hypothetical protein